MGWTMARAALVAILLVQCCNVVLAARLLEGDSGWLHGGELIVQVLAKGGGVGGGGQASGCTNNPKHTPGAPCP